MVACHINLLVNVEIVALATAQMPVHRPVRKDKKIRLKIYINI